MIGVKCLVVNVWYKKREKEILKKKRGGKRNENYVMYNDF